MGSMVSGQRVAFSLVCVILFAGCVGGDAGPAAAALTTAPAPTFSADKGSLTGFVYDDEELPLTRADVAVQGPIQAHTETDALGQFTINDLVPGSYVVFVQRLGYESFTRRADVVAGAATSVNVTLKPIALMEPRVETSTHTGFIDRSVYTAGAGVYSPKTFRINATVGAMEIVTSAKWQATLPVFARYMRMSITFDDATNRTAGRSPLTTNISGFEADDDKGSAVVDYGVTFGCSGVTSNPVGYAQCTAGNPDVLVPQVAYQQRVDFFSSVFYYQNAPGGYTGLD